MESIIIVQVSDAAVNMQEQFSWCTSPTGRQFVTSSARWIVTWGQLHTKLKDNS